MKGYLFVSILILTILAEIFACGQTGKSQELPGSPKVQPNTSGIRHPPPARTGRETLDRQRKRLEEQQEKKESRKNEDCFTNRISDCGMTRTDFGGSVLPFHEGSAVWLDILLFSGEK
jgi:hypothetical protein